jgi:hypothetical protein
LWQLRKENTVWCVDDGFTAKATNEEFTTGGFAVSDGAYGVEGYGFAVSHERSLSQKMILQS